MKEAEAGATEVASGDGRGGGGALEGPPAPVEAPRRRRSDPAAAAAILAGVGDQALAPPVDTGVGRELSKTKSGGGGGVVGG